MKISFHISGPSDCVKFNMRIVKMLAIVSALALGLVGIATTLLPQQASAAFTTN